MNKLKKISITICIMIVVVLTMLTFLEVHNVNYYLGTIPIIFIFAAVIEMGSTKKVDKLPPDYEGFRKHYQGWIKMGIPYNKSDLKMLANKYHTGVPEEITPGIIAFDVTKIKRYDHPNISAS